MFSHEYSWSPEALVPETMKYGPILEKMMVRTSMMSSLLFLYWWMVFQRSILCGPLWGVGLQSRVPGYTNTYQFKHPPDYSWFLSIHQYLGGAMGATNDFSFFLPAFCVGSSWQISAPAKRGVHHFPLCWKHIYLEVLVASVHKQRYGFESTPSDSGEDQRPPGFSQKKNSNNYVTLRYLLVSALFEVDFLIPIMISQSQKLWPQPAVLQNGEAHWLDTGFGALMCVWTTMFLARGPSETWEAKLELRRMVTLRSGSPWSIGSYGYTNSLQKGSLF